jgi:hypothetical protein
MDVPSNSQRQSRYDRAGPDPPDVNQLRQLIRELEMENAALRSEPAASGPAGSMRLHDFVDAFGLAAALGDASMPDRALAFIKVSTLAAISVQDSEVWLTFPRLTASISAALPTVSFDLVKTPLSHGVPANQSMYSVLLDMQALYSSAFWTDQPSAHQLVIETTRVMGDSAGWTMPYLLDAAETLARAEEELARLTMDASDSQSSLPLSAAAGAVTDLCHALRAKPTLVAGDLEALTTALAGSAAAARGMLR